MSSPVNEDVDKRFMYAPPWAREAPQQSSEAIIAAVERLRLDRQRVAAPEASDEGAPETDELPPIDRDQEELPLDSREVDHIEAAMAHMMRVKKWTPRSLDPVTMPDPPRPRPDGPTWSMVFRLGGAVGAAAIVALFATGTLPLPVVDITFAPSESAKAQASAAQPYSMREAEQVAIADATPALPPSFAATASAPAPSTTAEVQLPPAQPAARSGTPADAVTAYASLDTQPSMAALKANPQTAAPQPKLQELRSIDRDELAGLLKRGQALLAEGDIASARLLLRRAAEAGEATAALMLAGTYDRAELAKLKVIGVTHDHAQAKLWYTRAVEHGSAEAVKRLQQLAQRAD